MTKAVSIKEVSFQTIVALTCNGDEVVIEENGEPLARLVPIEKPKEQKQRIASLGKGMVWMSDDFDKEISFWENASDEDF